MSAMGQLLSRSKPELKEPYLHVFDALQDGRLCKLKEYQSEIPDFASITKNRKSLLHWAVIHGNKSCIKFLLDSCLDVNMRDEFNNTPLLEVVQCKSKSTSELSDIIHTLLRAKADINATNSLKRTTLLKSIILFRHNISEILLELGADTNIADVDGLLPIHVCATYSSLPLLRQVLRCNANIDSQDKKGRTALYFAILSGHQCIVDELLHHGCDLNLGSCLGYPLQTAIVKCKLDAVNSLLQHGVNVGVTIHEHRQTLSKAKDCLNLALLLLHNELSSVQRNVDENCPQELNQTERLRKSLLIVDLVTQAYGGDVSIAKNIFIKSRKSNPLEKIPDCPFRRKLTQVLRKLVFLQTMTDKAAVTLDGMPKLTNVGGRHSLENLCRMRVRKLMMLSGTNVMYAVEKLDCSQVVKDILLLRDQ